MSIQPGGGFFPLCLPSHDVRIVRETKPDPEGSTSVALSHGYTDTMTTKPPPRIPIPPSGYDAIATLVGLGVESVKKLAALVSAKRGVAHSPNLTGVVRGWAKELGVSERALSEAIVGALIPANGARLAMQMTPEDFTEAFAESVKEGAKKLGSKWKKSHSDAWPQIAAALAPMFAPDNFFSTAIKTAQLLGDQPAIFLDARILTELRPIYDETAGQIQTLLMTNTLALTYSQDGHQRMLHLTMDSDDLRKMASALARAEQKNAVAKRQAGDWGVGALAITSQGD